MVIRNGLGSLLRVQAAVLLTGLVGWGACDKTPGEKIEHEDMAREVAAVICEAVTECGCSSEIGLATPADCEPAILPPIERALAKAQDLELRFHGECLDDYADLLEVFGCESDFSEDADVLETAWNFSQCKLISGKGGEGEPCLAVELPVGGGDTCEHGLSCSNGFCRDWPSGQGDWCGDVGSCPPDLTCLDPDGDGVSTCEPQAAPGEPCNPHDLNGCEAASYCAPANGTCTALPAGGEYCLLAGPSQCAPGFTCVNTMCQAVPGAGQPCLNGACAEGLYCDSTSSACTMAPGLSQPCALGSICAPGLTCGYTGLCEQPPALVCAIPYQIGLCIYRDDGICDEPEGTTLCPEGTDPNDCQVVCPTSNDGICDEPEGTGTCLDGTDPVDCNGTCATTLDGVCDEPEGTGTCFEGTDIVDCNGACPTQNNGVCDEPEGTYTCPDGSDPVDCGTACATTNDGYCDEPEGSNTCPEGTDVSDCSAFCPYTNDGTCDEPEGTAYCPEGSDYTDCNSCATTYDYTCDEPEGTNTCPEGTDSYDCTYYFCDSIEDGVCDEPEGSDTCPDGSDVDDCYCASTNDFTCDEPEGTGYCAEGTDSYDCTYYFCPTTDDDVCDEPEVGNTCPDGTDVNDCTCLTTEDQVCDEPEGTNTCAEGTDELDCAPV